MADITRNINYKLNFIPGTMGGIAAGVSGLNQFVDLSNEFFRGLGGINVLDASLVGLAATLLSVQTQAASAFGEFEKGLTSVQAISQELTGNMNTIASASTQLSIQFGKDVNEITAGLETLGRAGLTGLDNQLNTLKDGFNLSTIEGMELNKALETLVQTTTLLGGNMNDLDFSSDVQKVNDLLVGTSMAGPLKVSDVAMTLKYAGGTAAVAGANLEDTDLLEDLMGTIATFAQRGVVGDPAGTALRAFLTNPAGANSNTVEGLEKIGLTPENLWEDGGEKMLPISDQVRIINRAMDRNGLSQQERIEVWSDIVGTKVGQQMLKLDADDIDESTTNIQEQATAQQIAEQSMNNLNKKFESLNQAGQALWRSFGEASSKSIGIILDALTGLLDALSNPVLATTLTAITTLVTTNAIGRGINLFSRLGSRLKDVGSLISPFYALEGDVTTEDAAEDAKEKRDGKDGKQPSKSTTNKAFKDNVTKNPISNSKDYIGSRDNEIVGLLDVFLDILNDINVNTGKIAASLTGKNGKQVQGSKVTSGLLAKQLQENIQFGISEAAESKLTNIDGTLKSINTGVQSIHARLTGYRFGNPSDKDNQKTKTTKETTQTKEPKKTATKKQMDIGRLKSLEDIDKIVEDEKKINDKKDKIAETEEKINKQRETTIKKSGTKILDPEQNGAFTEKLKSPFNYWPGGGAGKKVPIYGLDRLYDTSVMPFGPQQKYGAYALENQLGRLIPSQSEQFKTIFNKLYTHTQLADKNIATLASSIEQDAQFAGLKSITGIGHQRTLSLLGEFGSLQNVLNSSKTELAAVKNLTTNNINSIMNETDKAINAYNTAVNKLVNNYIRQTGSIRNTMTPELSKIPEPKALPEKVTGYQAGGALVPLDQVNKMYKQSFHERVPKGIADTFAKKILLDNNANRSMLAPDDIELLNKLNRESTVNALKFVTPANKQFNYTALGGNEAIFKNLASEFGSVENILRRTDNELLSVNGVNKELITHIRANTSALQKSYVNNMNKFTNTREGMPAYIFNNSDMQGLINDMHTQTMAAGKNEEQRSKNIGVLIDRASMANFPTPNKTQTTKNKISDAGRSIRTYGRVASRAFWHGGMLGDMMQMGEMYAKNVGATGTSKGAKLTKALGTIFSFFGPIEAGLIGVQAAMALYDAKLKEHQEALAEASNKLEESTSNYDDSISKLKESYLTTYPDATDEEVEEYITNKEAGMYDLTTATVDEGGVEYVDVSHYDANTYELYRNTLAIKENTQKYNDEVDDDWFGISGFFTEVGNYFKGKPEETDSMDYLEELQNADYSSAGLYEGILDSNIQELEGYTDEAKYIMQIGRTNSQLYTGAIDGQTTAAEWFKGGLEEVNWNVPYQALPFEVMIKVMKQVGEDYQESSAELSEQLSHTRSVMSETFGYGIGTAKRQTLASNVGVQESDARASPFFVMNDRDIDTYRTTLGSMTATQSTRIGKAMNDYGDEFNSLSARMVLRDRQSGRVREKGEAIDPKTGLRTSGNKKGTSVYDEKTHNEIKALANKTDLSYTEVLLATQLSQLQQMNSIAMNQLLPQIMSQVYLEQQGVGLAQNGNQINTSIAGSSAATSANAANIAALLGAEVINQTSAAFTQMNDEGLTPQQYYAKYGNDEFLQTHFFDAMAKGSGMNVESDAYTELMSKGEGLFRVGYQDMMATFRKGMQSSLATRVEDAYNSQLEQLAGMDTPQGGTGSGSGDGSGSGSDSDSDKESNKKNYVDLVICNKKTIPKLNVNLFKKEPTFKIQNQNLKLRDIKINTQDKPKAISSAVKNAIIDVQERTNPKIIQDQEAEYNPVEATEGTSGTDVPTGTTQTN